MCITWTPLLFRRNRLTRQAPQPLNRNDNRHNLLTSQAPQPLNRNDGHPLRPHRHDEFRSD